MTSRHRFAALVALLLIAVTASAAAQEGEAPQFTSEQMEMMEAWQAAMTPGEPHALLAERAGSFDMTVTSWMDATAEPMVSEGSVERAMLLGGRVLEERVESEMMGQAFEGIGRTGYDNVSGRYWNTWIDSMSTGCYMSHGDRDPESGVMTFAGEYDDPSTGGKTRVRAVVHPESDGKEVFEWYEDRGAGELKTMVIVYRRK